MPVSPHLGDHHCIAAQFQSLPLGSAQPGYHRPIIPVHRHERPCVEDKGAHAAGSSLARPSSRSAREISAAVRTPCSASQPARNSASASALSLLAAASASHDDTGFPACAAAERTASPSSGSNEILSLSTFTTPAYPSSSYHGSSGPVAPFALLATFRRG